MAVIRKLLGQAAPAATTETVLYTVPPATTVLSSSVVVCNRGGNPPSTFRVSISVGGAATGTKDYLYHDMPLGGHDSFAATLGITMAAGDVMRVYASTANLSFTLFGQEES